MPQLYKEKVSGNADKHLPGLIQKKVPESARALAVTIQLVQVAMRAPPGCTNFGWASVLKVRFWYIYVVAGI